LLLSSDHEYSAVEREFRGDRMESYKISKSWLTNRPEPHDAEFRLPAVPQRDRARPIEDIGEDLAPSRGDPDQEWEVTWTLRLRVGMITGKKC
jgi:hypothetical protein